MVYSTNLDAARRACDRRMVTFAHTAPDCAEIMWNEQNWTLVSMPITSTRAEWDEGLRTVRQFNDLLRVLPPLPQETSQEAARRRDFAMRRRAAVGAGRPRGVAARGARSRMSPGCWADVRRPPRTRAGPPRPRPFGRPPRQPFGVRPQRGVTAIRPLTTSADSAPGGHGPVSTLSLMPRPVALITGPRPGSARASRDATQ